MGKSTRCVASEKRRGGRATQGREASYVEIYIYIVSPLEKENSTETLRR